MSRFSCDPNLTGNLTAEYEALQNDLEQAKSLARDYQNQLCDKSNDVAALKLTLEKTAADLEKLQQHIVALRHERHKLANEVMRVVSLEAKLAASEARIAGLTEELRRERAGSGSNAGAARPAARPVREFIELGTEEPTSLIVIPTPSESRGSKPYQPRA